MVELPRTRGGAEIHKANRFLVTTAIGSGDTRDRDRKIDRGVGEGAFRHRFRRFAADGAMLPGKNGVSLPADKYIKKLQKALKSAGDATAQTSAPDHKGEDNG